MYIRTWVTLAAAAAVLEAAVACSTTVVNEIVEPSLDSGAADANTTPGSDAKAPTLDAGLDAPDDVYDSGQTVTGVAGGFAAVRARAYFMSEGPAQSQVQVRIATDDFSCAQMASSTYPFGSSVLQLSVISQSYDGGVASAIADGTYALASAYGTTVAIVELDIPYSGDAGCSRYPEWTASGEDSGVREGNGSITFANLDGGVSGSFVVVLTGGAGTVTGTFDATLCTPAELETDAGTCP